MREKRNPKRKKKLEKNVCVKCEVLRERKRENVALFEGVAQSA